MTNVKEISNFIKEKREEVRDIENIPAGLSPSEKVIHVQARQELSKTLGYLIDQIEGKRPAEGKPKKHPLLP